MLLEVPVLEFYSLQKREGTQELKTLGLTGLIQEMGPMILNFADMAAVLTELDLLISADTTIVHFAGL